MGFFRMSMGVGLAALLCCGAVSAQTVYESKQGGSTMYSDRPLPGGRPVELKPLNVIESAPAPPPAAAPAPDAAEKDDAAPPKYRSFAVTYPESGGSVLANAVFEVRVSIDPPLQIAKGHAFTLRFDGRSVPGRFTTTEMVVPPEFFGDTLAVGTQQHVLDAAVVDARGTVLTTAAPVGFYSRMVNVLSPRPRPPMPAPKLPPPKPPSPPVEDKLERGGPPPAGDRMRLK